MAEAAALVAQRIEGWLKANPPTTLLGLADRLFIASVDRSRLEGPTLAARFYADVLAAARSDEGVSSFTTLCVCSAAMKDWGVDVDDLVYELACIARFVDVERYAEPFRSTARYWLWRVGLARSFVDDGAAPADPRHAYAFHTHRVLFASGYGATRPVENAGGWCEARSGVDVNCADSVALILLCAGCVGRSADVDELWQTLGRLERKDGALHTHVDSAAARHHAACVAVLAASFR